MFSKILLRAASAKKLVMSACGGLLAAFGVVKGGSEVYECCLRGLVRTDISGKWCVVDKVKSSTLEELVGVELRFELFLMQSGTTVSGSGTKMSANNKPVLPAEMSAIEIKNGFVDSDVVKLFFEEKNDLRPDRNITGTFTWKIIDQNTLRGSFFATAAKSSGESVARKC